MSHMTMSSPLFWQVSSQREGERRVTIAMNNVRALIRARHFLAGILIGAVILLPVFLLAG